MGLRRSLDLGDLDQRLVAYALLCVGCIQWLFGPVNEPEHVSVRAIGIVRNREAVYAAFTQTVHPLPEIFGVCRVDTREGHSGYLVAVTENDVAVEVTHVIAPGRELVGDEGREAPGVVVQIRRADGIRPS